MIENLFFYFCYFFMMIEGNPSQMLVFYSKKKERNLCNSEGCFKESVGVMGMLRILSLI